MSNRRCKNGTRKNKKTGECENKIIMDNIPPQQILQEPVQGITKELVPIIIKRKKPKIVIEKPTVEEIPMVEEPTSKKTNSKNNYLLQQEKQEYVDNFNVVDDEILYPTLNDPNFTYKLSKHKEFFDNMYDGKIYDIRKQADLLCKADFELLPHQIFIKNFLSLQTPYNSLLLYNGLGSGKTCSAIGVTEEMRTYMRQIGIKKRIIIIASPDVQKNFMLQLFDERKLIYENGLWRMNACTGNSLLNEINPTGIKQVSDRNLAEQKKYIVKQIRLIINAYYVFFGYDQFAKYFLKKTQGKLQGVDISPALKQSQEIQLIQSTFNNRLIVIDEVHNIRVTNDNKDKKNVAIALMKMAKYTENMRLLLLSATPMYNTNKEIVWLTNLMNMNDKRAIIEMNDVFEKNGDFVEERIQRDGKKIESGMDLLRRKLIGYISYVRGENPYSFPYRIYPNVFAPQNVFPSVDNYPKIQMNKKIIDDPLKYVPVYLNRIGDYQNKGYQFILDCMMNTDYSNYTSLGNLREMPGFEELDSFSYNKLQTPIQALNIIFPNEEFDKVLQNGSKLQPEQMEQFVDNIKGKQGIKNIMTSPDVKDNSSGSIRSNFKYKPEVLEKYGRIFAAENLHKYSAKIANICRIVKNSKGIVLIYSQYIDGGIIPISLALEEMGFTRFGTDPNTKSLFETPPVPPIDAVEMVSSENMEHPFKFKNAKYVIITGDKLLSPNNAGDLKYITHKDNKDGEMVKVVLISKTGSEGLDFKNIRQVHILDPWFNMNRIEQIIGRGVRNLSHCQLPFEERNVEIYLHSTILENPDEEAADLYLYRLSEKKAIQIGKITRLLKEVSVDCILNLGQTNFTVENMIKMTENQKIMINLSSNKRIEYQIGDRPYTDICDYMDNCAYKCYPNKNIQPAEVTRDTYNDNFLKTNHYRILFRIQQLFREKHFYKRSTLIDLINVVKQYPIDQIFYTLTYLIVNKTEYLVDKYGRLGNLINRGEYYAFQPIEITNDNSSIYELSTPIDYKQQLLKMELPKTKKAPFIENNEEDISQRQSEPTELVEQVTNKTFDDFVKQIAENVSFSLNQNIKIPSGDKNWYKHTGSIVEHLKNVYQLTEGKIKKHVIFHMLDNLLLEEKINIVIELFINKKELNPDYDSIVQDYFQERTIYSEKKDRVAMVFADKESWKIFVFNGSQLTLALPEDLNVFKADLARKMIYPRDKINSLISFTNFKENKMHFNIKDLTQKRNNVGARIDSAGKKTIIKKLNEIVGENKYTVENTKKTKINNGITEYGLACIFEIIVREYNSVRKDGRIWYMSPEPAIFNNIEKI